MIIPGMFGAPARSGAHDAFSYASAARRVTELERGPYRLSVLPRRRDPHTGDERTSPCPVAGYAANCSVQAALGVLSGFSIGERWPSGLCITLTAQAGRRARSTPIIFIVRPTPGRKARRVAPSAATELGLPTTPGRLESLPGITGPKRTSTATTVSHRSVPGAGIVVLPEDAATGCAGNLPAAGDGLAYPHLEWAGLHGYCNKYAPRWGGGATTGTLSWRSARLRGDLASRMELQFNPEILDGYDCIVCVATTKTDWEMPMPSDAYVERGGRIRRGFRGQFPWQTLSAREIPGCYNMRTAEDPSTRSGGPFAARPDHGAANGNGRAP